MSRLEKIALTKIKGIGPKLGRNLLAHFGNVENLYSSSKKQLLSIPGIGPAIADAILSKSALKAAEEELKFIEKHHIDMLWITDQSYPNRLVHCEDAPILMYYKGQGSLQQKKVISIVGTRNATTYGRRICEDFIGDLQDLDVQIISGLAYGIDIHAHKLALQNNLSTIGVLGHGLDRIYPATHRDVATKMMENGGLLTEFPSGTNPDRTNFPMRNRIIAGLSDVTIVIEAASKGGALITAEIANSYNRDVCAFPGGIDQEFSAGCNYLIKTNRAHLIRNTADLCYLMNWESNSTARPEKQLSFQSQELSPDEKKVHTYLKENTQASIDTLSLYCNWPQSKLAIILLEMEINNLIVSLPGRIYKLI